MEKVVADNPRDYTLAIKSTQGCLRSPGDGKSTWRARASRFRNRSLLERCPKPPGQVKRLWRSCGPSTPHKEVHGHTVGIRRPLAVRVIRPQWRAFRALVAPGPISVAQSVAQRTAQKWNCR